MGRSGAIAALVLAVGMPLAAQQAADQLRVTTDSLAKLRQERDALERQRTQLQGTVHTISDELANLAKRRTLTEDVVRAMDRQLTAISAQVEESTGGLAHAQDQLAVQTAILQRRLIDIYKRGPLAPVEILLSATSFSDLISRYKWLHILTQTDQARVRLLSDLHRQIADQQRVRVELQRQVEQTRADQAEEQRHLDDLRRQQTAQLQRTQGAADAASARISVITRAETQLNAVLATLAANAARRPTVSAPAPAASAIRAGAGFDWPVEGRLAFRFGPAPGPNNTVVPHRGIGIVAPAGTPVRAVAAAQVDTIISNFSTYGTTVILNVPGAGGGYFIYGSLGSVRVSIKQVVNKGDVIGTVGISDQTVGPYLYFEVRRESALATPVDPLTVLRAPR